MYAKIFDQIFDSSIADDYELRHFFMDLLVLSDQNGMVDKTPHAISARTRVPLEKVMSYLKRLEEPDKYSRTPDNEGRRIQRLDEHREWGWVVLSYARFRDLATHRQRNEEMKEKIKRLKDRNAQLLDIEATTSQASKSNIDKNAQLLDNQAITLSRRESQIVSVSISESGVASKTKGEAIRSSAFCKPTLQNVKLHGIQIGLSETECEKFFDYYESNGWKVGRNTMKLWTAAMANWKRRSNEYGNKPISKPGVDRNEGTANAKRIGQYDGVGKVL